MSDTSVARIGNTGAEFKCWDRSLLMPNALLTDVWKDEVVAVLPGSNDVDGMRINL